MAVKRDRGCGSVGVLFVVFFAGMFFHLCDQSSANADRMPEKCVEVLVGVAPCLGFLAAPPINDSSAPSPACCAAVAAYADVGGGREGGAVCLCRLVRNPGMLGFPIVGEQVSSLFSACSSPDDVGAPSEASAFESLCEGSRISPASPSTAPDHPPPRPAHPLIRSPVEFVSDATRTIGRSLLLRFHSHLLLAAVFFLNDVEEIVRIITSWKAKFFASTE